MVEFNTDPTVNTEERSFFASAAADEKLYTFISQIQSNEPETVLVGTRSVRKILSREEKPPIDQVIKSGVIPRLVQLLDVQQTNIQFEAAWALTNIASGNPEQTKAVIDSDAVPAFVRMCSSPDENNREQATWALGNIAGDSPKWRDYVLECGAFEALVRNLHQTNSTSYMRNGTWALSNLVRGKPSPDFKLVAPCLKVLYRLIHIDDEEMLGDVCWALSYLTDGEDYKLQAVIDEGLVPQLVKLLQHRSHAVSTPALRTIGNIVTGSESQTQTVIDMGGLIPLRQLLMRSPAKNTTKEVCWALSNITAGTAGQIQAVIQAGFLPNMLEMIRDGSFEVKKEVTWAISNLCSGGTDDQIRYLMSQGFMDPICALLTSHDSKLVQITLEALQKIMAIGEVDAENDSTPGAANRYALMMESNGGVDALEELQSHAHAAIYKKATDLLDMYFEGEDDEDEGEENMGSAFNNAFASNNSAPAKKTSALFGPVGNAAPQSTFTFGGATNAPTTFSFN